MKVSDIVLAIPPVGQSNTIRQAIQALRRAGTDILPVADGRGRIVGALTVQALLDAVADGASLSQLVLPYVDPQIPRMGAQDRLEDLPAGCVPAVVFSPEGALVGVVTAQQFASGIRSSIADSQGKLMVVLDAVPSGILAIDEKGTIIFANRQAGEIIGATPEDVVGCYVKDIIPNTRLLQIMEEGIPLTGQKFSLGARSLMVNYSPMIRDGVIAGAVSVFQDLTEIEKISEELGTVKALNQELEAIIACSYDGIWITDGQGVVLKLNKASERFSERQASEIIGKNMLELVADGLIDRSATLMVMEQGKQVTTTQTVAGRRKLLATGTPMFDDNGRLFRVVTNVRDITELTHLQDQLLKEKERTLKYKSEISHLRSLHITGSDLVFRSESMSQIVQLVSRVADVDSTVLITGESGAGKELVAKLIHRQGKGYRKPLITVNCSAIPELLLESELFGYEGGAFTGARKEGKPGMFELAHTGTLFLDEIGDLTPVLQVKLLRAIQSKEVVRVGGTRPITVDVRIIAATNRDLQRMLKDKTFREDLYYRLMVVPIHVPPLRERREDIPILVYHFVDEFNRHFGFWKRMSPQAVDKLINYDWPGNVRELRNCIERMMVTAPGDEMLPDDLPDVLRIKRQLPKSGARLRDAVAETEIYLLTETYKQCGSWVKAARILGVNFTTIYRKASRYKLIHQDNHL